jgi:hypothetical protein
VPTVIEKVLNIYRHHFFFLPLEIKQTTIHLIKPIDPFKELKEKGKEATAKTKPPLGFLLTYFFFLSPTK